MAADLLDPFRPPLKPRRELERGMRGGKCPAFAISSARGTAGEKGGLGNRDFRRI